MDRLERLPRSWKWGLIAIAALALMVTWRADGGAEVQAAGTPSPDIAIGIAGVCSTNVGPPPETPTDTCIVPLTTQFTVQVSIITLTGLPDIDGDTIGGYDGIDVRLAWSGGLTRNDRPGVGEVVGPQCDIRVEDGQPPNDEFFGACRTGSSVELTTTGVTFEVDFECDAEGSFQVAMLHGGALLTLFSDESNNPVNDLNHKGADEVLTIDCSATAPPLPGDLRGDVNGDGGVSAGDIAIVVQAFGEVSQ